MKNKILKFLYFVSILFIISCGKEEKKEIVRPVKIQEINLSGNEKLVLDFTSKVSATTETKLAFKIAGTIKQINFEKGDFVKKGEEIAVLDSTDYKLNLEVFSKKYEAAKAVANNANLQFARAEKLHSANALSQKDFDEIQAKKTVANSMFKEARAGFNNARNTLKDTKLLAPYDGYIDKKIVDVGTVVNSGLPVISFISNDISDIQINVSLKDIENLKNAKKIVFKDDNMGNIYPLKIKNISQTPDATKLTYPIDLTFKDEGANKNFSAGETGNVQVEVEKKVGKDILIPLSAVFEENGANVYLFKEGLAVKTKVKIGDLSRNNKIIILDGLKNGDKVIIAGVSKLTDGNRVRELKEKKQED